jgi:hypothetical protein
MVVVCLEPNFRVMDRAGCASGTRAVAMRLWSGRLPKRRPEDLVRELYREENRQKTQPSGSQDMIGLIYPGISRLDYDFSVHRGVFPSQIESLRDNKTARWLEGVLHVLPIEPRPDGYDPLGVQNIDPAWIVRLGQTGKDCFEAIRQRDISALGASMNACMLCWEKLLPQVVQHSLIKVDLKGILRAYQRQYHGAMYSGCGGGYLFVVSRTPVPGSFRISIRTKNS